MSFNLHHDAAEFELNERVIYRPASSLFPGEDAEGRRWIQDGIVWSRAKRETGMIAVVSTVRSGSSMAVQLEPLGMHFSCHPEELTKLPQPAAGVLGWIREDVKAAISATSFSETKTKLWAWDRIAACGDDFPGLRRLHAWATGDLKHVREDEREAVQALAAVELTRRYEASGLGPWARRELPLVAETVEA